jgi:phosphoribosylglycinamide formyltransferase 2
LEIYNRCTTHQANVIAVDSYENAPTSCHDFEVNNQHADGDALDKIVAKHQPDFIVPEIEAIRTERFMITRSKESVVPSASGKLHYE